MTRTEKQAHKTRMDAIHAAAQVIVNTGVCPDCGTKLFRNLSLTGWWVCGHRGSPGFQEIPGPHCDFQCFTEA